jgi:hypothetical protein
VIPQKNNNMMYGHYRVGSEIYTHKISALIEASKLTNHVPQWDFHDHVYSQLNWQEDLGESLDQVYQRRARQLREKYDYLVLSFSGGSDSWTVLQAFIDSGTHLDEIFVRWPLAATHGKYSVSKTTNASNILSEWELTIRPMLDQYQKIIPRTKITIHDWSNELLSGEVTDQDWMLTHDYLNPGSFLKYQAISRTELAAINAGKKTAVIFGTDKPQLCYKNGQVYCYFLDKLANSHAYSTFDRVSELFYWSPDMPEITHIQSRALYNYIKTNSQILSLIDWSIPYSSERKYLWDAVSRSIIYKKYSQLSVFQANKPHSNVLNEVDAWMTDLKDFRYIQSWKSGLKNVLNSVDPKFIEQKNDEVTGFIGFISGNYCLGPASLSD